MYYWPATGKAETIRMLLAEAGVPFEESNFEKPDGVQIYAMGGEGMRTSPAAVEFFEACRAKGGNLTTNTPMLEVDGRCYTQSVAIYKLVARHGGLYPSDDPEAAYIVDSVVAHCEDAFPLCYQVRARARVRVRVRVRARARAWVNVREPDLILSLT